ncbi:MAG: cytochrome c oxidase assembly factor Coa1 family protein [Pirellulaceae bacterium]|nr:cytochrome c oxidase assembly factor Coa1 family protein [Pirellulaceae bacterium]
MSTGPFNPTPEPKKSGGSVVVIILIVVGVLFLGCAGACGVCIWGAGRAAQQVGAQFEIMSVMVDSMTHAQEDQRVIDKLGEPLTVPGLPARDNTGEINPVHESFQFKIVGTKGEANATGHATKAGSFWKLTSIDVVFSDGEKITIIPPADDAMELNFPSDSPTDPSTDSPTDPSSETE